VHELVAIHEIQELHAIPEAQLIDQRQIVLEAPAHTASDDELVRNLLLDARKGPQQIAEILVRKNAPDEQEIVLRQIELGARRRQARRIVQHREV